MTSTPPLFVTYPLTPALTPVLDELAQLVVATREQAAMYAFASAIILAHSIYEGLGGERLHSWRAIRRTALGETELNPALGYQIGGSALVRSRVAPSQIRIAFSANCSIGEFASVQSSVAKWFGCAGSDVMVYSVGWMLGEVRLLQVGGAIVILDTFGTEFILYSANAHEGRMAEWIEKWRMGGGLVETVGMWDPTYG